MTQTAKGYAYVIVAGALWATLGPTTRILLETYHLPPLAIPFLRCSLSAVAMFGWFVIAQPQLLKTSRQSLPFYFALGIVGVAAFYVALTKAVELAGVSLSVVILYIAPTWVAVVGALLLDEPFTRRKALALGLSVVGCALAVKVYDVNFVAVRWEGIVASLAATVGYTLFAVFTKVAIGKYDSRTMVFYAYAIAALTLLPLQTSGLAAAAQPQSWLWLAFIVGGPTLGAWALFSQAVRHIPVSNASIAASVEPIIANVLAFAMFGELLEAPQLLGGIFILAAVVILQVGRT